MAIGSAKRTYKVGAYSCKCNSLSRTKTEDTIRIIRFIAQIGETIKKNGR